MKNWEESASENRSFGPNGEWQTDEIYGTGVVRKLKKTTDDIHFRDTYEEDEQLHGLRMQQWRQS